MSKLRSILQQKNAYRYLIIAIITILFSVAIGEEQLKRSAVDETQRAQFEKNMEDRLARDIEAYLGHQFFIVRADARLEKVDRYDVEEVLVQVPIPPEEQAKQTRSPPQKDERQRALEEMALETEDGIEGGDFGDTLGLDEPLPGLPLSANVFERAQRSGKINRNPSKAQPEQRPAIPEPPQAQFKTEKKKIEKLVDSRIETKQLSLKVIVDEHVTPEQETFIKQLVVDKAGINFIRGDELRMLRTEFPGAKALDPAKEEKPPIEESPATEEEKPVEEPAKEWQSWLQENWPLVAAATIILLLLLIMMFKRKRKEEPLPVVVQAPNPEDNRLDKLLEKMGARVDLLDENRVEAIREEIVSLAVTDYALVNGQLKEWLSTGNEDDLSKIAALHSLLGSQFTSLFKSILDPESMIVIAARAQQQLEEMQPNERLALVESVYQGLMQKQYKERHGLEHEVRPFSFLERLNDDQIMFLIRNEDIKVKALVLSQLNPERAANILKRGSPVDKTRLATEVSLFRELPVEAFRDVANRLARRAVNVPSFANIEMDGVDLLTDMLDHMSTAEETELLSALKQDNPNLFYQIKKVYISFTELYRLPKLALRNLVREISREQLALALYDMPEAYQNAIFEAMLERPRAMLISTIRNLQNPDEETVEDSKRMVARKAREMLKAGAISLTAGGEEQQSKGAAA